MTAIARAVTPRRARHWIRRRLGSTPAWNAHADYRPPKWPPAGLTVSAPDFVGVGAQRSGSTWWWALIHHHPAVFHLDQLSKERRFLLRFFEREPDDADVTAYASWFPHPRGSTVGEWTPIYLSYPWMGSLLRRVAPNAKVLAIVRDPVERYRSGVELQRARGVLDEPTTLRQVGIGCYARQLAALEGFVDPARVLVLQYERCREEPDVQLARTFRFLGLEAFDVDAALLRRPTGQVFDQKPPLSAARRSALVETYGPDVDALVARYPEIDRSLWPNFR
jgi:Sulfotransferase domain